MGLEFGVLNYTAKGVDVKDGFSANEGLRLKVGLKPKKRLHEVLLNGSRAKARFRVEGLAV